MVQGWSEAWELWLATSSGSARRSNANSLSEARTLLESLPPDLRGTARGDFYEAAFAWTHGKLDVACERAVAGVHERVQEMRYRSLCGLFLALSRERPAEAATWLEAAVVGLGALPIAERPKERASLQRALALAYADAGHHRRAVNVLRLVPTPHAESAIVAHDLAVRRQVLGGDLERVEPAEASMSTASMAALRSSASDAVRTRRTEAARDVATSRLPVGPTRLEAVGRSLEATAQALLRALTPASGTAWSGLGEGAQRLVLLAASLLAVYSGLGFGVATAADIVTSSHDGAIVRALGPHVALLVAVWLPGALACAVLVGGSWILSPDGARYSVRSLWLGPLLYALLILLCAMFWRGCQWVTAADADAFRAQPLGIVANALVHGLLVMGVVGLWTGRLERRRHA